LTWLSWLAWAPAAAAAAAAPAAAAAAAAAWLDKGTEVIKLTELVEELTKQLIGVVGTELVDQLAKLRQLIGFVRLANLA